MPSLQLPRRNEALEAAIEADGRPKYLIAVAAGMSPTVLSSACTGRLVPSVEQAQALARELGRNVDELFGVAV